MQVVDEEHDISIRRRVDRVGRAGLGRLAPGQGDRVHVPHAWPADHVRCPSHATGRSPSPDLDGLKRRYEERPSRFVRAAPFFTTQSRSRSPTPLSGNAGRCGGFRGTNAAIQAALWECCVPQSGPYRRLPYGVFAIYKQHHDARLKTADRSGPLDPVCPFFGFRNQTNRGKKPGFVGQSS
ncbi:hypothetical protein M569_13579 [Genlisea aurea]|uniref:Uncharacterized protein n=1 Tax=Genlisea aurea TaxID=192259 RepID=S8C324_9LAMI|nr:hypothetical protein M569_13579 [Genlisea aurea]